MERADRLARVVAPRARGMQNVVPELILRPAPAPLMPLVESFYLCRYEAAVIDGVERVDMGQIRFMLRGEGVLTFPDGREMPSCPVMINGPGTAAATYRIEGPFHCFGLSLRAIGWRALVGLDARKVADQVVDGAALFGPEALDLLDALRGMDDIDAMIAQVTPFLLARRKPVPKAHLALARAVREWAVREEPTIDELFAAAAPMSRRQVTRLCDSYYGGPPTHLRRKFRAIGAAMRLYQGASVDDVAGPFSDQPHMINEIKHFTGHTPTTLRTSIDPILAATLDSETFHILPEVIPEDIDPDAI